MKTCKTRKRPAYTRLVHLQAYVRPTETETVYRVHCNSYREDGWGLTRGSVPLLRPRRLCVCVCVCLGLIIVHSTFIYIELPDPPSQSKKQFSCTYSGGDFLLFSFLVFSLQGGGEVRYGIGASSILRHTPRIGTGGELDKNKKRKAKRKKKKGKPPNEKPLDRAVTTG
ncbi:hypothetical protein LZ30DRAFT_738265 [Colletotrichum cereale]|nr:hypothetical protein LZ30DRAFT_738265 [Colletotrichum cereale]